MTDKQSDDGLPALPDDEAIDAIVACLGDDAAQLRDSNPEDERADNMDAAASLIEQLRAAVAAALAARQPEGEAVALEAFDDAVETELMRVSTVPYNSHDICRWFAANVRGRLAASPAPQAAQAEQAEAPSTVIHQHGFAADNNRLRVINESLDKQLEEVMAERDERDDVLGRIAGIIDAEFTSAYGFADLERDLEERLHATQPTASNVGERLTDDRLRTIYDAILSGLFYEDYDKATEMTGWLRAALATKPPAGEQKPVAVVTYCNRADERTDVEWHGERPDAGTQLYTAPQPEQVAQDSDDLDWLSRQTNGDITICAPGHHGGAPDGWLIGVETGERDRYGRICDEYEGPTLRDAIRAARTRGEQGGAV